MVNPATIFLKKGQKVKTKVYVVMLVLCCGVVMSVCAAEKAVEGKASAPAAKAVKEKPVLLVTETDKVSYSIGTQIADSLKRQGTEINLEALFRGLKDGMAGGKMAMTQDEMRQVMMAFRTKMMAKQQERQKADQLRQQIDGPKNLAAGMAFLAANAKKKGVKVLPSGLQYRVIEAGIGKTPTAGDTVRTHYRGTLIDGTEFDSSYKKNTPVEFGVTQVIKGWTEALQLMKEGAKWQLFIPANLAYGERGRPSIPSNSTLIFDIELLAIVK